jgi:polyisoprenoid-binding protein YceI
MVIAAVVAGGFGLWYVLIGPPGPAPVLAGAPAVPSNAAVAAPASLDGTWNVDDGLGTVADATATFAGYRVQEQLAGVGGHVAVGRTGNVTGSMTLTGAVIGNVQVSVDMTTLKSDDMFRDDELKTKGIETDIYPTATFKTTAPFDLHSLPAEGATVSAEASGDLDLHGVTRHVTMTVSARRIGGIIAVSGSLPILFSDYSIERPISVAVISVDDHGTMEFHLLFIHA